MREAGGWVLFISCLLLLSFAATTRYSKTADLFLISMRLALVAVLSLLVVREWWQHRNDARDGARKGNGDRGDTLLQRCRDWCYGETEVPTHK